MFPFAHSCSDFPPDAETLMEAGLGVAKAMRGRHGQPYQAGQACDLTFRYAAQYLAPKLTFKVLLVTRLTTLMASPMFAGPIHLSSVTRERCVLGSIGY